MGGKVMNHMQKVYDILIEYVHALDRAHVFSRDSAHHTIALHDAEERLKILRTMLPHIDLGMPLVIRSIIMHSLGAKNSKPRSGGTRNCYAPSRAINNLLELGVEHGWLEWGNPYQDTRYIHVTEAGAKAAGPAALYAYRAWARRGI
jgi:hypothetical protein